MQLCQLTIKQALNQWRSPQVASADHFNCYQPICDGAEEECRDEGAWHCKDCDGAKVAEEVTLLEGEASCKDNRREQAVEECRWGESQARMETCRAGEM